MMHSHRLAVCFALLSIFYPASLAQTPAPSSSVITVLFAPFSTIPASILAANPAVTTYVFGCPSGAPTVSCSYAVTLIEGPSTISFHDTGTKSGPNTYQTIDIACSVTGTTAAQCTNTLVQNGTTSIDTSGLGENDIVANMGPITVTAGLEKLPSNVPATTTATGSSSVPTGSGSTTSSSAGTGTGSGASTPSSTPSSTPNAASIDTVRNAKAGVLMAALAVSLAFVGALA